MESLRSRWKTRRVSSHRRPCIHMTTFILQRCLLTRWPGIVLSSSPHRKLLWEPPFPSELPLSTPHIQTTTDCTQTCLGCLSCNAIQFSQVGGSAQHNATCKLQQTQPPAQGAAFRESISRSKLNWANMATGKHPTGGEWHSLIKYNLKSAGSKIWTSLIK